LGDVVRTSYFAGALRRKYGQALRLCWLTSTRALPLLRHNPHIDKLTDDFHELHNESFDHIYSLDDEREILGEVSSLRTTALTGAYLSPAGAPVYTPDSAEWFDMGLLSRFGKTKADELKRKNTATHAEIFARIFGVEEVVPEFWGQPGSESGSPLGESGKAAQRKIGINPFAGGRWPSKQLRPTELTRFIGEFLSDGALLGPRDLLVLIGAGDDKRQNQSVALAARDSRVVVADTDPSPLRLASLVADLDLLVTSDSLALHLAIAQRIPFIAFFAPTSAVEIDTFGRGIKIVSTSPDYCSYLPSADNSSLTAGRLLAALREWSVSRNNTVR